MRTTKEGRAAKIAVKGNRGIKLVQACTINRSREDLYGAWRQLENLPQFMKHLVSVTQTSETESHWIAKSPGNQTVEWDAIIINERPNELIAWRSKEGADIDNAGSVRFEPAPQGKGTEVTVALEYNPPAGRLGALVAKLYGKEPQQQVADDLRRFKAWAETGEIPTIEGQPVGQAQKKTQKS